MEQSLKVKELELTDIKMAQKNFPCRFVVSARIADGKVAFKAVHDPNDGAHDAWVRWAESTLQRAGLPAGWVVLVTP